jgi:probable nitrogen fixation protein
MTEVTLTKCESAFLKEIVKQIRAIDTFGEKDKWPAERIVAPFILTKEQKREIPVVGDPDEDTMTRVKAYYNAIATLLENATGLMPMPMLNLHHEGFGRALITIGRLVVFDKTLRDVHRFGFPTAEKMQEEAEHIIAQALELVAKFRPVAEEG